MCIASGFVASLYCTLDKSAIANSASVRSCSYVTTQSVLTTCTLPPTTHYIFMYWMMAFHCLLLLLLSLRHHNNIVHFYNKLWLHNYHSSVPWLIHKNNCNMSAFGINQQHSTSRRRLLRYNHDDYKLPELIRIECKYEEKVSTASFIAFYGQLQQ